MRIQVFSPKESFEDKRLSRQAYEGVEVKEEDSDFTRLYTYCRRKRQADTD